MQLITQLKAAIKTIGEYVPSMVIGYVPYKAGTVTYTATIKDTDPNGTENVVSGSKDVTYKYLNPLTSVTTDEKEITIKANEESAVNLTFTGENLKKVIVLLNRNLIGHILQMELQN